MYDSKNTIIKLELYDSKNAIIKRIRWLNISRMEDHSGAGVSK